MGWGDLVSVALAVGGGVELGGGGGFNDLSRFSVSCSHFRISESTVMVNGQRSTVNGQRSKVKGQRSKVNSSGRQ